VEESVAAERLQDGLPPGFELSEFVSGARGVRFMAFGPDGVLYATVTRGGTVLAFPDRDGDGKADETVTFAEGLQRPHGIT